MALYGSLLWCASHRVVETVTVHACAHHGALSPHRVVETVTVQTARPSCRAPVTSSPQAAPLVARAAPVTSSRLTPLHGLQPSSARAPLLTPPRPSLRPAGACKCSPRRHLGPRRPEGHCDRQVQLRDPHVLHLVLDDDHRVGRLPLVHLMREAIRGNQRQSEPIRGHQRPSRRPSPPAPLAPRRASRRGSAQSEPIRGHQRSSAVIRGHQRSSEVIRGHQRSSERTAQSEAIGKQAIRRFDPWASHLMREAITS